MKLNKYQKKFISASLAFTKYLYDKNHFEVYNNKSSEEEIISKVAKILMTYTISDEVMKIAFRDKVSIKKEMNDLVNSVIKKDYENEVVKVTELLTGIGRDKYNYSSFLYNTDNKVSKLTNTKIDIILNEQINGKNYKDRIWSNNKNQVSKILKRDIFNFIDGRTGVNEIEKNIRNTFSVSRNVSKRLVENEISRVQTGVNEIWMKDNGIEYVLYDATLDTKTCENCSQYDGKSYSINDDRPSLPLHVKCRCAYLGIPSPEWRPNKRLDNVTGANIDYKAYNDWSKENIISTGAIGKIHKDDIKRKSKHAFVFYNSIRKRHDDINKISINTGINKNTISKIKEHLFINKHELEEGYRTFYEDFEIAQAWQRLIDGKNIKKSDIVLLKHERLESYLMSRYNYKYSIAHDMVNRKYNYVKALMEDDN